MQLVQEMAYRGWVGGLNMFESAARGVAPLAAVGCHRCAQTWCVCVVCVWGGGSQHTYHCSCTAPVTALLLAVAPLPPPSLPPCVHIYVSGDGGVIKTILSDGSGWQHPNPQDEVVLTYTARITDPPAPAAAGAASAADDDEDSTSAVVASSPEGGAVFVASEAPCSGLAAAVRSMKQQEAVRLLLKPECE